jgi:hypothetical protein
MSKIGSGNSTSIGKVEDPANNKKLTSNPEAPQIEKAQFKTDSIKVSTKGSSGVPAAAISIAAAQKNVAAVETVNAQHQKDLQTKLDQYKLEIENQMRQSQLEAQKEILPFRQEEEKQLSGLLNEQLSYLEDVVKDVKGGLNGELNQTTALKGKLPLIMDNKSVDYSLYRQIEGQEEKINNKINRLDDYVQGIRSRSNNLLAKVNSDPDIVSGTAKIDKRISDLRQMLGELSASPFTKDLLAARLK